jgi:dolichol kinase
MTSSDILSDLILFLGAVLFELIIILVPKALKHKGIISGFIARKIIHSFAGLAVFIAPFMKYPILAVIIAVAATIMTRKSEEKSKTKLLKELYDAIHEDEEIQLGYLQGPFAYCVAITILTFIFIFIQSYYYFAIAAILIMMYADTLAAVFGRRYGKHSINIPWVGSKRTVEGSIAFFVTALLFSFLAFFIFGYAFQSFCTPLTMNQIVILTFIISLVSTGLELISPSKYDDLLIPLGTAAIGCLIGVLMAI